MERFPPETVVYSGHGPPTTLGDERDRNPFLASPARVKFEAPRGTHDILPADAPLWRRVDRRGGAALRALRLPADPDAGLRGHGAVRADVGPGLGRRAQGDVHVRGPRRTLAHAAAGATAPICRAYLEHGLHREPQPQKLYTIATIYRYGRPQKGRYREHWQLSVEAIGSDDPALDAEVIQLYDTLLRDLGVTRVPARAELDRRREVPSRLPRAPARMARRARRHELDDETRDQARRNPLRALDNFAAKPAARARRLAPGAGRRRRALRRVPRALRGRARASSTPTASSYELVPTLVRGLDYYTRTTWEFVGPEHGAQS